MDMDTQAATQLGVTIAHATMDAFASRTRGRDVEITDGVIDRLRAEAIRAGRVVLGMRNGPDADGAIERQAAAAAGRVIAWME